MIRLFILLPILLIAAACAATWQKPGASEQEFDASDAACQNRAHDRFPPLYRYTLQGGRYRSPLIVPFCNRDNPGVACRTLSGDYVFPSMAGSDGNLDARWNDYQACLLQHGWQPTP
ncbi:MAG: hypothetical protein PHY92_04750 [Alphaproteobacteria bacterium]|nr:hypothetical protein [Alphaproteobacteria bacterium]